MRRMVGTVILIVAVANLLTHPTAARAYNCGGLPWQTITVSLSSHSAGESSDYTIATRLPALDGCDLTPGTLVTIDFPADTNTESITAGSLNRNPITFTNQVAQSIAFKSPLALDKDQVVVIVLNDVTNPTGNGTKTLALSASSVQNGSIGRTTSDPYSIVLGTPTPTQTPTPTATPTATPYEVPSPTRRPPHRRPRPTPTAPPVCLGDCDGNGDVSVEELIRGVDIALGTVSADMCTAFIGAANQVTVNELVDAVNSALNGCP